MMTIAYYQGALDKYKDHAIITRIIKDSRNCDYIIAPRIGFWLDNSNQTPQQTVETILNVRKPV